MFGWGLCSGGLSFERTGKHYNGELFSVNPSFLRILQQVFVVNERVVLQGTWNHGNYVAVVPVAATNVGNIVIGDKTVGLDDGAQQEKNNKEMTIKGQEKLTGMPGYWSRWSQRGWKQYSWHKNRSLGCLCQVL